jgi:hypothetical protein
VGDVVGMMRAFQSIYEELISRLDRDEVGAEKQSTILETSGTFIEHQSTVR